MKMSILLKMTEVFKAASYLIGSGLFSLILLISAGVSTYIGAISIYAGIILFAITIVFLIWIFLATFNINVKISNLQKEIKKQG